MELTYIKQNQKVVIASEAKQSSKNPSCWLDCFGDSSSLLAMTADLAITAS
jgi:hypothetical protein